MLRVRSVSSRSRSLCALVVCGSAWRATEERLSALSSRSTAWPSPQELGITCWGVRSLMSFPGRSDKFEKAGLHTSTLHSALPFSLLYVCQCLCVFMDRSSCVCLFHAIAGEHTDCPQPPFSEPHCPLSSVGVPRAHGELQLGVWPACSSWSHGPSEIHYCTVHLHSAWTQPP